MTGEDSRKTRENLNPEEGKTRPASLAAPVFLSGSQVASNVTLSAVTFQKLLGERLNHPDIEPGQMRRTTNLTLQETAEEIRTRSDLEVWSRDAHFELSVAASWVKGTPFTMAPEGAREFSEKVAFIELWPYLRAELQALSARLSLHPITLPLLRVGEIEVG